MKFKNQSSLLYGRSLNKYQPLSLSAFVCKSTEFRPPRMRVVLTLVHAAPRAPRETWQAVSMTQTATRTLHFVRK